ncbi:MAG: tetratricopeptide repeat protein [Candidatus Methanoperedens sp.]|nr:tetratricopeptide repeat protein [Candidatus Methanoperedens sp.]
MIFGKKKKVADTKAKPPGDTPPKGETIEGGATMWITKGNNLVESSMYAEAIQCYDKALEINPISVEVLNNRGLALARTGRLGDAVKSYDLALVQKPGDPEVLYNKGIALAQMGKAADALECYDKLLAADPADANTWCSKGDVLFEAGNYDQALMAYDRSIQLNPKDETAWNNRGMTLVKFNRYEEAIESYDKALEINPRIEKIWSNKGLAIAKMNEKQDQVDLQKIAATLPKEVKTDSQVKPGSGELQKREDVTEVPVIRSLMEKTIPGFEEQAAVKPETVITPVSMADTSRKDGQEPLINRPAAVQEPTSLDENMVKGNQLYSAGKYEEAIECYSKLLEKDINNKTAWNNKGLALGKIGRLFEAIGCYDKALEIAPNDNVVINNKASALFKKGLVSEALECFKITLVRDPGNKTANRGIELCNKYFANSGKKDSVVTSLST